MPDFSEMAAYPIALSDSNCIFFSRNLTKLPKDCATYSNISGKRWKLFWNHRRHSTFTRPPKSRNLRADICLLLLGAISCHARFVCCLLIYNFLCCFILLLFRSITVTSARYLSVKFGGNRTCLPAAFYSSWYSCFPFG